MVRIRHLPLSPVLMIAAFCAGLAAGSVTGGQASPAGVAASEKPAANSGHAAQATNKIRVSRADDLPQHAYPFQGQLADLVESQEQVAKLASAVRTDLEGDLAKYEIEDVATLKRIENTLLMIDVLEGRSEDALARVARLREMEEKPALKLMSGIFVEALMAARGETGARAGGAEFGEAFRRQFAARLGKLPWSVVQDEIEKAKGSTELMSANFLKGSVLAQYQPKVDQTGQLNGDSADAVLRARFALAERLPLREQLIAAYAEKIAANHEEKADIWAAREVTLKKDDCRGEVLVAVWDSGTDPDVFKDALWRNKKERQDDEDNDFNGYLDDVHGIAYNEYGEKESGLLCPLGRSADRVPDAMKYMKGLSDLRSGISSPEGSQLQQHLGSLAAADVKVFMEDLNLAGNYIHGTHVAGIMLAGNPCARLMIARLTYDYRMVPVARTLEWGERDARKDRETVEYFQKHNVQVVNMSWGEALKDAEDSLEANGLGANAEERRNTARQVFKLQRDALYTAIKGAPDILFVCAAGNSDSDVGFEEEIPSSFELPNLIVVGAVDQAGEPTSFTSFGRAVRVYANGFEVDSYVPGGQRMKLSGTSMASPGVANLAAKIMAIDPQVGAEAAVDLIKRGAEERTFGERKILLINPQKTLELTRQRMKS